MPINKEMIHPGIMLLGSALNVCGSIGAINAGADKVHGNINPFFYIALCTSSLYVIAQSTRIWQLWNIKPKNIELEKIVMER